TALDAQGRAALTTTIGPSGMIALNNRLSLGHYALRFEHPDCELLEESVEVGAAGVTKISAAQTSRPGELRIFSVPAGAEVLINDQIVGKTPATLPNQLSETPL